MGETEQLSRPLARAIASRPVQTNTDKDLEPGRPPIHKFLVSETAELHLLEAALSRAPAHARASAHMPAREAVRL
jgi:hypothetical protein